MYVHNSKKNKINSEILYKILDFGFYIIPGWENCGGTKYFDPAISLKFSCPDILSSSCYCLRNYLGQVMYWWRDEYPKFEFRVRNQPKKGFNQVEECFSSFLPQHLMIFQSSAAPSVSFEKSSNMAKKMMKNDV